MFFAVRNKSLVKLACFFAGIVGIPVRGIPVKGIPGCSFGLEHPGIPLKYKRSGIVGFPNVKRDLACAWNPKILVKKHGIHKFQETACHIMFRNSWIW